MTFYAENVHEFSKQTIRTNIQGGKVVGYKIKSQKKTAFSDLNMPQGLRSSHLEDHDVYRIYMNGEQLEGRCKDE